MELMSQGVKCRCWKTHKFGDDASNRPLARIWSISRVFAILGSIIGVTMPMRWILCCQETAKWLP